MRHSTSGYWFKAFEFPENPRSIASLKAVFQRFNPYKSLASPPIKSINPHDSSYFHMVSADLPWFSMIFHDFHHIFTTFSHHSPVGSVGSAIPRSRQRLTKGIRQLSRELPQGQEDEGHHRIPGPLDPSNDDQIDLRKFEDILIIYIGKISIFNGENQHF